MKAKRSAEIIDLPLAGNRSASSILRLVRNRVGRKSDNLLSGLHVNIADALFDEMSRFDQEEALSHHFNIMRAMKEREQDLRESFHGLMSQAWNTFPEDMDERHIAQPDGEIVEWIKALSSRTQNHYKVLLQETRFRFQTVLGRSVERHPLVPDLYYRAFWQSMSALELSYDEKRFVLPMFHRFFMNRYGQLVVLANRTMFDLKVDLTRQAPTSNQ